MIIRNKYIRLFWFIIILYVVIIPINTVKASAKEQQTLTIRDIKKGAETYLKNILPWEKDLIEVEIFYHGRDIVLPPGKRNLKYTRSGGNQKVGRIPIALQIKVNGIIQRQIGLNSIVRVSQQVVKTTRLIRKGEIFTKKDISLENIKTERVLKNTIKTLEEALGYEAIRNIPNGYTLLQRELKKPALGNKGDKVLILVEKRGMKITTPGILKEDGYENALVKVLNIESKKTIYGRLINSDTVKVSF